MCTSYNTYIYGDVDPSGGGCIVRCKIEEIQVNILVKYSTFQQLGNESNYFVRVDFSAQHRLSTNNREPSHEPSDMYA